MKRRKGLHSVRVQVYLTPEEYATVEEKFRGTTERFISHYIRKLLQHRPMVLKYRNQSLDEFVPVALDIKNELQLISRRLNEEIRLLAAHIQEGRLQDALEYLLDEQFPTREKIEEIKDLLSKTYDKWSQE